MSVHVRPAEIKDFNEIHQFVMELEKTEFEKESQFRLFEHNIMNGDNVYLVAEEGQDIVGYVSCHIQGLLHHGGLIAEIQELFVVDGKRGKGIGRKLLSTLKDLLRPKYVKQLEVTANIQRSDTHEFYQREGFVHTHKKFVIDSI